MLITHGVCMLLLAMMMASYRFRLLEFKPAFSLIGVVFILWLLFSLVALIYSVLWRPQGFWAGNGLGVTLAFVPMLLLVVFFWQLKQVPPIADITTNIESPPPFTAVLSLRDPSENTPVYNPSHGEQQKQAYPDIAPVYLNISQEAAFSKALAAVAQLGWTLVEQRPTEGCIEAYDQSTLFGFIDDVVICLQADQDRVRVDMRSASRVGVSDLGANAKRIRQFLNLLQGQ